MSKQDEKFVPDNMTREKTYGISPQALKLVFILFVIAVIVELVATKDIWASGPVETLPDYSVVLSETKIAEHDIHISQDNPLRRAVIDNKSYYVFCLKDGNSISDTLYIPEDRASVILADASYTEVYEQNIEYYVYNKYTRSYQTNTDNAYYYILYINNENIEHIGNISNNKYFGISVWPYFFTIYR